MNTETLPGSGGQTREAIKLRLDEASRINREREVRLCCCDIALRHGNSNLKLNGLLGFVRPDETDFSIRLKCLMLAATQPTRSEYQLLSRAELLLQTVTEADND